MAELDEIQIRFPEHLGTLPLGPVALCLSAGDGLRSLRQPWYQVPLHLTELIQAPDSTLQEAQRPPHSFHYCPVPHVPAVSLDLFPHFC